MAKKQCTLNSYKLWKYIYLINTTHLLWTSCVFQEDEYRDLVATAQDMEENYGHYFDSVISFDNVDYVFQQLMYEINLLEREPQWVPARWVRQPSVSLN